MLHTWSAYATVSRSRQMGMAAGPVPLSEVLAYCQLFGVDDPEEREELVEMIGALDSEYLNQTGSKGGGDG